MPRVEPEGLPSLGRGDWSLAFLLIYFCLLICYIFPTVYIYVKGFAPKNPAFQQIFFANDEKFGV